MSAMPVTAHIVNAFTVDGRGGNPAGVVVDADGLDADRRLAIAREIGLSETAFVSRSETDTIRLEFFTPTRQIAHCGHATIATFALLRALGRLGQGMFSKETIDGSRSVLVEGASVFMQQRAPRDTPVPEQADALRRALADVPLAGEPVVVDTGNRFLLAEVAGRDALAQVVPDQPAIARLSETLDVVGAYLFTREAGEDFAATTRMFAPRYGIDEEAATGMAAGPLACLLHARGATAPTLRIEQGALMVPASPSAITVRLALEAGRIQSLFAGGEATVVRRIAL